MPLFERPTSHGDLFVEYNVVLPTKLSQETRQSAFCRCLVDGPNIQYAHLPNFTGLAEAFYGKLHRSKDEL